MIIESRFTLGHIICTQAIKNAMVESNYFCAFVCRSLKDYLHDYDWASLCPPRNLPILCECIRLPVMYRFGDDDRKIFIVAEGDRCTTCVLFKEEYQNHTEEVTES